MDSVLPRGLQAWDWRQSETETQASVKYCADWDRLLFISSLLMILLILSKGAQRRKSGEKRKDRKKEATEEEKGCSEKKKLVIYHLEMDHSALCSCLSPCFVNLL